jgi:hypothetical protein
MYLNLVLCGVISTGGYVVPGSWAYHYFEAEEAAPHFRFEITIFSGTIYLLSTRPDFPPSFTAMAAATYMQIVKQSDDGEGSTHSIIVCNGAGRRHYVGLYGGERVATYIIHAAPFIGDCETGGEDEGYIEQRDSTIPILESSGAIAMRQLCYWRPMLSLTAIAMTSVLAVLPS